MHALSLGSPGPHTGQTYRGMVFFGDDPTKVLVSSVAQLFAHVAHVARASAWMAPLSLVGGANGAPKAPRIVLSANVAGATNFSSVAAAMFGASGNATVTLVAINRSPDAVRVAAPLPPGAAVLSRRESVYASAGGGGAAALAKGLPWWTLDATAPPPVPWPGPVTVDVLRRDAGDTTVILDAYSMSVVEFEMK